jgi:hypothetical protein
MNEPTLIFTFMNIYDRKLQIANSFCLGVRHVKELVKEKKTLEEGQTMNTHHGPWVDYKFQDAKFFQDVKKLLATR